MEDGARPRGHHGSLKRQKMSSCHRVRTIDAVHRPTDENLGLTTTFRERGPRRSAWSRKGFRHAQTLLRRCAHICTRRPMRRPLISRAARPSFSKSRSETEIFVSGGFDRIGSPDPVAKPRLRRFSTSIVSPRSSSILHWRPPTMAVQVGGLEERGVELLPPAPALPPLLLPTLTWLYEPMCNDQSWRGRRPPVQAGRRGEGLSLPARPPASRELCEAR